MDNNKKDKKEEDKTSAEASIKTGKQAIDVAKKTAPQENEKKDSEQKKDAEQWRNEG